MPMNPKTSNSVAAKYSGLRGEQTISPKKYLELLGQGKAPRVIRIFAPELGSENFGGLVVEQQPEYVRLAEKLFGKQKDDSPDIAGLKEPVTSGR